MGMIPAWVWNTIAAVYLVGFLLILILTLIAAPNVTFALALLRALLWPVFITTGHPQGAPMTMD